MKWKIWYQRDIRIGGLYLGHRWVLQTQFGKWLYMTHPYLGGKGAQITDRISVNSSSKIDIPCQFVLF